MNYSGRITVRITRKHGSRDDYYFHSWSEAIGFMKRTRRFKTDCQASSFEIFFNDKE